MVDYVATRRDSRRARAALPRADVASFVWRLDWVLLAAVAALVGIGLWAIGGITRDDVPGDSDYYFVRQALFATVGAAGLVLALVLDPELLRRYKRPLYGAMVGLVLVVLLAGAVERGSRRWIDIGSFRLQPSEFAKVLFVLCLAAFLADNARRIREHRTVLAAVALALPPVVLVFLQPDIGTALAYGAALFAVLFFAGVRWLHLGLLAGVAGLAAVAILWALPAVGVEVLKPYQVDRLTAFTNPDEDPGGITYNVNQSVTAVGAGGVRGRGVSGATQTNLDYLPEHATDFVFASFAEQRGFVGAALLLALYLLVVWRGLRIVTVAGSAFSAIVAGGIVGLLLFQIAINVGMTMGIAPVTGIPLPFVSVGGSSMITNLVAVGLLLGICARGRSGGRS